MGSGKRSVLGICLLGILPVLSAGAVRAETPPVPHHAGAVHLGVASCASVTCHGAISPWEEGAILQDEYNTWQQQDRHSKAYAVLLNEQSQRIARNLGLPDAHTAKICLDCHADNVPEAQRGPQFQLTDGVGCEACHGGAERWVQVHTITEVPDTHARNLAAGLYPTEDPVARARLCLSCHLGDETKLVTHRIMGAGHPRLSFELDTFTAIQPAHFVIDDDYDERKQVSDGAQTWAIGQALAVVQTLDLVLDPQHGRSGLFPEIVFFDCHACHKPMSAGSWRERASLGLGPGVIRFNDSNLIMLRAVANVVSPPLGRRISEQSRALHRASQQGERQWAAAARALRASALEAADVFARHEFGERDLRALLDTLVQEGNRGEFIDYVAAEQTTMAIGALIEAMRAAGWIDDAEYERASGVMDEMYTAVKEDERYRPTAHQAALRRLQTAVR